MKIVIFTGGTGSIALQKGLYKKYSGAIDVSLIINAYDSGKSTGLVRQVYDGKILGPSDLRKNQHLQFKLSTPNSRLEYSIFNKILEHRFSVPTDAAKKYCLDFIFNSFYTANNPTFVADRKELIESNPRLVNVMKTFQLCIEHFFSQPLANIIEYSDFSISNIIYAALAAMNNYSLEKAGSIMADILQIPDNIILNSDQPFWLEAESKSGYHITDEGEIVDWNNIDDPIQDIRFGHSSSSQTPELSERAKKTIEEANLVILSSGTYWSSLIPTYKTIGVKELLEKKIVYCVMNNTRDKDMAGKNIQDHIETIERFLNIHRGSTSLKTSGSFTFIINNEAADVEMRPSSLAEIRDSIDKPFRYIQDNLNNPNPTYGDKVSFHDSEKLANLIMTDFFGHSLRVNRYAFDYDDTLVGRNNSFSTFSSFNIALLKQLATVKKVSIQTGNSIHAIRLNNDNDYNRQNQKLNITIYADGGINKFEMTAQGLLSTFPNCLDEAGMFRNDEVESIIKNISEFISKDKIRNRNNATISIKPIDADYRDVVVKLLRYEFDGRSYNIRKTGKTTIDISKWKNSKKIAMEDFTKDLVFYEHAVFVGDELYENGNDFELSQFPNLITIPVNNPKDTYVFLKTLIDSMIERKEING